MVKHKLLFYRLQLLNVLMGMGGFNIWILGNIGNVHCCLLEFLFLTKGLKKLFICKV